MTPSTGGGIANSGTLTLTDSTLTTNFGGADGGGIANSGTATLINATLADNRSRFGGGIANIGGGTVTLINATLTTNFVRMGGGGIYNASGLATLQNTILALNTFSSTGGPPGTSINECLGVVTSRGNNLIGDTAGCTITLQSSDLTGDPGLDAFTDDGTPGNGHVPLLSTSRAIDAGNDAACPKRDQLGEKRVGLCDIGAIEFQGTAVSRR
jgi:hypothetical protein